MVENKTYQQLENENKILRKKIESEERNYKLFESMTDAVCILDKKGNILDVNAAGVKLYGYNRDEILKMNVSKLIYEVDKEHSDKYFDQLRSKGQYKLYEGRVVTKSKKVIWVQVNSSKYFKNGIEIGSLDIIRDITIKKENELKIIKQNTELQRLNATKDKFFTIVAHDLKNPFNSLLGLTKLLNDNFDTYDTQKQKTFIKNIYSTLNNTFNLLKNLLLWSRSQRGKNEFIPKSLNLWEIANETIELLNQSAHKKSISLKNLVATETNVFTDKNMLLAILRNLISNAIKFTPNNGDVYVESKHNDKTIEICVVDTGRGISKEDQSKLFKIDENVSRIGTNNEEGTGLGLILCKEFIEELDGKIWVESEPGKGSKFIFTLKNK